MPMLLDMGADIELEGAIELLAVSEAESSPLLPQAARENIAAAARPAPA
ncbi:hypothetical protein GCM10027445_16870 [Amycolatopsis endophytica]|uniref:Uncharacterized protein n=1 Tax=Amycolatopsis endophytica TaxID=860233 RepID=A0A853B522_9PSEU|nr:hypothetical protein [Amycolatopsis endophytica]